MTEIQNWGNAQKIEATDENVEFLATLAQKLGEEDEVLVQNAEDTETTPETVH